MSTSKPYSLYWAFALLLMAVFTGVTIGMEKPEGGIAGKLSLEMPGFGLSTYDIRDNKVYVIANGPRGSNADERGAWVQPDGTFAISRLPVGEYSLRVRAPGYATDNEQGIFVEEGRISHLHRIRMTILDPSVNIASNSRVFTTKESPSFWVNATGAIKTDVKIYPSNLYHLMEAASGSKNAIEVSPEMDIYKPARKPVALVSQKPVASFQRKLEPDVEDWARAEFKLSKPLPAGDYIALAEVSNFRGKQDWNLMGFTVTDLGLIVKQAPEKTVIRAIDLNTLQPRSGVNVQMLDRDNIHNNWGTLVTGQDGFATLAMSDTQKTRTSYNLLAYGTQGQDKAYGGVSFWRDQGEHYHTYFYTERPIYRLGQTVYYKGITRLLEPEGYRNPTGSLPLSIILEDPDNNKIGETTVHSNSHGTFHGTFEIPADGKTGAYQVTLKYPDGSTDYERFEVAQYRKPEYQVDVIPEKARVISGSRMSARIKASYYFGAPVAHARVKYSVYAASDWQSRNRLMPHPDYYGYYDDWDDSTYDEGDYAGDYVSEGYAQTDENGEAVVSFDTKKLAPPQQGPYGSEYGDKRYKIEAEVTDLSRMTVVSSGAASVTAGQFAVFIQPRSYVVKAGETIAADVTAVDYEGHPVKNQAVNVRLMRWIYDSVRDTYRGDVVEDNVTVRTDDQGKAVVSLKGKDKLSTDTYYLSAQARDDLGNTIYDENTVWIASGNAPFYLDSQQAKQEPLSLKLDKPVYQPGETARVMVTAPVTGKEGSQAIVSVEGSKLFDYRVVPMTSTAQLVEIPLKADYAPNVYVNVTFVGPKHQFYNQTELIKVSPEAHFLKLAVETNKSKYKPGEDVTYTVKATFPNGIPAKNTEVSLGVVDESIYAIRPEVAEDIQKFFYKKRSNWVTTICSFPEQYSGGPDKIEPRVRKDFRDMAAWFPELTTNDQGIATATVHLPDNLTTWRATARAITMDTDVGSATQKILSTQDLLVRLALPRFFTQGDDGLLTAIVHNYTDQVQNVHLTLNATSQFKTDGSMLQELSIKPDEAKRYSWPVKVIESGEATVGVKAIGQTDGDALEIKLPVRPLGIEAFDSESGILKEEAEDRHIPINLPKGILPAQAQYLLSLSASSIAQVLGSFSALIDYPYGCTEQTMDRLMPSIIAMRLNKDLSVPLTAGAKKRFTTVYNKAMGLLTDGQHEDGGWGWWVNDDTNVYLTTYVMEGLYLLRQSGYRVDADMTRRGKQWLHEAFSRFCKQLQDPKLVQKDDERFDNWIDLSQMAYVLSLYDEKIPVKQRTWLLGKLNLMSPEALASLTLAFHHSGDTESAQKTYEALIRLANHTEGMMDWDHTPALMKRLGIKFWDYTYRFTGVETTAMGLRAVVAMEPGNESRVEALKNWLLLQRDKNGWQNTKTTAQVLRALMEEAIANHQSDTAFQVMTNLANTTLATLTFNAGNLYEPEKSMTLIGSQLPGNMVNITKQGPGKLYFHSLLSYILPLKPGDTVQQKSLPEGLHLSRSFYRLQPGAMTSDGNVHFRSEPIVGNTVRAGETILMRVNIDSPVKLPYVLIDAALPSGGEVVSNDPREGLMESEESENSFLSGDWGDWWWSHQDILDDRVVFFASDLPAGKSQLYALVRMEMPGTFQMNPVKLEGMYTRNVRAYSPLDAIKVVE